MDTEPTTYERLREVIQGVLDRDGQHDWDETARLADIVAAKVWNELSLFPLAGSLTARLVAEAVRAADYGIGRDGCPFCGRMGPPRGAADIEAHDPDCIARLFGATGKDPES